MTLFSVYNMITWQETGVISFNSIDRMNDHFFLNEADDKSLRFKENLFLFSSEK